MPLLLVAMGVVLLIAAVRGQTTTLFDLLKGDFTGPNNYLIWMGAILGVGMFGYIRSIRPIASAMLVLIVVSMVLSDKGFFTQFAQAFQSTTNPPPSGQSSSETDYLSQALSSLSGAGSATSGGSGFQLPSVPSLQGSNLFSDLNFGSSSNAANTAVDVQQLF
jgi:hypothetical protein